LEYKFIEEMKYIINKRLD